MMHKDAAFRACFVLPLVMMTAVMTGSAQVARYVTPAGAGDQDGSSWVHAYSVAGLQAAVDAAIVGGAGSIVYLKEGTYPLTAQLSISAATGLTLSGGWAGNDTGGLPGDPGTAETVLTRDPGTTTMRIMHAATSTLTITNLTITDGYLASASAHGAGIYLDNCQTILTGSRVVSNRLGNATLYGMGIYATGGSLTLHNSEISGNSDQGNLHRVDGGGLYATSVNIAATNVIFADNSIVANNESYGGGVFLNAGNARFVNCEFRDNRIRAGSGGQTKRGGALHAQNVVSLVLTNCVLTGNAVNNNIVEGGTIYVSGAGTTEIVDTRIDGNAHQHFPDIYRVHGDDLYLNVTGPVFLRNTEITSGSLRGIYKAGTGSLSLTNCLVGGQPSHGLQTAAGTITIANTTIAGNGGWGLTNSGATVTTTDSIIWNNRLGGISPNGLTMTYTCNQDDHAGTGNVATNPLFVAGYRLAVNGLPGQTADSPGINAGSQSAAAAGLDNRTTRTDGAVDSGTVDLGYHFTNAVAGLNNLSLYVDVNSGNDVNSGHAWGAGDALRTIGAALSKAIDGSTIHIATGAYDTTYETFPLTVPVSYVILKGTNRNTTIINADASARLFEITGKAGVTFEGLTLTNGVVSTANGAGMLLINSSVALTNCVLTDCRGPSGNTWGVGIYAGGGTLTVLDSILKNQHDESGFFAYGGAIFAKEAGLTMTGTLLENNRAGGNNTYSGGGALHLVNGWTTFSNCTFNANYMRYTGYTPTYRGGCIYANGVNPMVMVDCTFTGNYADGRGGSQGGVLYREGAGATEITGCVFDNNVNVYSGEDLYFNTTGSTYIRDTSFTGGSKHGIFKTGAGSMSLANVLIAGQPQHGILAAAGTLELTNVTLANNTGWGLTNTAATVTLLDSILWGNALGGVTANGLTMTYTCNQDGHAGDGNFAANPLFTVGYYLSVDGQPGQTANSPCIDAGSRTAAAAGLDARTTRTDGAADSGTVDLGWHYEGPAEGLANLTLYVDVNTGNDGNSGHSWGNALRSIGAALAKSVDGSTIHIATGAYNTAYETFPLTILNSGITLKGTNRNATVINADASGRILSISGKTGILLDSLTFTNGYVAGNGAGISSVNSAVVITNCTVAGNRTSGSGRDGIGIYVSGGAISIFDSELIGNRYTDNTVYQGGGLYASGANVSLQRVRVADNVTMCNWNCFGAGIFLTGGQAEIAECAFTGNGILQGSPGQTHSGGAIYATAVNPLLVTNCVFTGNYALGSVRKGNVMYLGGAGLSARIVDCVISNNAAANSSDDIYIESTGTVMINRTVLREGAVNGIYMNGVGTFSLTNTLVHSYPGNGIQAVAGSASIASTTLAGNGGWGLSFNGVNLDVENTIAWGNTGGGISATASGTASINYTLSQEAHAGTANQDGANPKFTDAPAGGYTLDTGSPAINNGFNRAWMTGGVDLAGEKRIVSGTVDLGAYESAGALGSIFLFR